MNFLQFFFTPFKSFRYTGFLKAVLISFSCALDSQQNDCHYNYVHWINNSTSTDPFPFTAPTSSGTPYFIISPPSSSQVPTSYSQYPLLLFLSLTLIRYTSLPNPPCSLLLLICIYSLAAYAVCENSECTIRFCLHNCPLRAPFVITIV